MRMNFTSIRVLTMLKDCQNRRMELMGKLKTIKSKQGTALETLPYEKIGHWIVTEIEICY